METRKKVKKLVGGIVIAAVFILLLLVFVVPSIHFIQQGERGVVRRMGVDVATLEPGPHFRLWITNDILRYSILVRDVDISFQAHTLDAQTVTGNVTVQYQLMGARVRDVASQFGTIDELAARLYPVLMQETQNVFAMKSAMDLVQQRANLGPEIWERLIRFSEQFHVIITNVALENVGFSPDFERAIDRVAVADQELLRAQLDVQRDLAYAQRDLEITRIQGEEMVAMAEAEARALRELQAVWDDLTPTVREVMLRQQAIDRWDGALPRVIAGDGDTFPLILDTLLGDDDDD